MLCGALPFVAGCDSDSEEPITQPGSTGGGSNETPATFLDGDVTGELPEHLSEVGLFVDTADRTEIHERATLFEPKYALWTNGSEKERYVVVPEGEAIDSSAEDWEFPVGTLFFKTFSYPKDGGSVPVETRVIRLTEDGFVFDVYQWNEDGTDAALLESRTSTKVEVTVDGDTFEHEIPSRLQCRMCHESQEPRIIGFDELRLNYALPGHDKTQLEELADRGVISHLAAAPLAIEEEDPLTLGVLGYLQGNCVHCHNGGDGVNSAFSMDYRVAVENLVGVDTTSELLSGLRVKAGVPEESALFLALSANPESTTSQPMPPVGVQRVDAEAVEMVEEWIVSLDAQ